MKILVICQYFYPEQFRVSDVCFTLAAAGHEITVLTGLPNYPAGEIFDGYDWSELKGRMKKINDRADADGGHYEPDLGAYQEILNGVRVLRTRLMPRKTGKKNLALNYISFAYQASKAARALVRSGGNDFDKILVVQYSPVTMAIPGILLKRKLGKPLIFYSFDLWPESIVSAGLPNHGPVYFFTLKLSQWIYRQADLILTSSKNFRKYFESKLDIKGRIEYLPIYAEELFQSMPQDPARPADSSLNLLFAGNIGEMQSMETIIGAADHLKDHNEIRFHVVGDGSALEKSKQLASDRRLENVVFHGRHPLEDMPKFYEMADAFLVTLKRDEFISYTLPGKVQSYMACGKPILAAIDGETADVIMESGSGLCCSAEDSVCLAGIILRFSEEKEMRREYGAHASAYYNAHFSKDAFFRSLTGYLLND